MKKFLAGTGFILLVLCAGYYAWSDSIADGKRLNTANGVVLDIGAGEVEVVGTPGHEVRVSVEDVPREAAERAKVRIDQRARPIKVEISNLPEGSHTVVQVPEDASLAISMGAGQLTIHGVKGDTFAVLRSGQLDIKLGDTAGYRDVRGFVLAGAINAPVFGADRGGVARPFHWRGPGKAQVVAHVTTGEIELE